VGYLSKRDGIDLITAERVRQVQEEGWTAKHDDVHDGGELVQAACCYANAARYGAVPGQPPHGWPWDPSWWKARSNDPIGSLVKAGALIAAEIDRIQRQS
jgi:hypothetical protein